MEAGSANSAPIARRVAIVVVTFNSADVIGPCLLALPDAVGDLELEAVIVADNCSEDDTIDVAIAACPGVTVVRTGGNLGYSAAINMGERAAGDYELLFVVNPDAVPAPSSVELLSRALSEPNRGLAVPLMINADGTRADSIRREPSLLSALSEAVLGGRLASRLRIGETVSGANRYRRPGPVAWATGAAVMLTRSCWHLVGAWDESFFLYSEETDYMLRARDAGLVTWFEPAATVMHRGGESSTSPELWSLMLVNKARLYARRHSRIASVGYWLILLGSESARAAIGRPRSRVAVRRLLRFRGIWT